jgi:hypothetical protein
VTRDPLDDLASRDPGLTELLSHLTSEPSADELSGEYAALMMFRTVRDTGPLRTARLATPPPQLATARRRRRPSGARLGGRLVAAASVFALGGGFAAAGYAAVLPAPLQHVAHQILGFAGVPNSPGKSGSPGPTVPVTSHRTTQGAAGPGGSHSPRPGSSGSTSPSPRRSSASPSPAGSVTISAGRRQIAAGSSVQITASFTRKGRPIAGVSLSLSERAAGRTAWHVVRHVTTGTGGQASFTIGDLITNASFRASGPGQAISGDLSIVVIPAITFTEVPSAHGRSEMLIVSVPLAQRADVVRLEELVAGQWQLVRSHRLHTGGQTEFSVVPRKISVTYRVVLSATVEHGQSVSGQVTVAARPNKGGHGGR